MKFPLLLILAATRLPAQVTFPIDLAVSRLEVIQTAQDDSQSVALIAGKATAARVFVRQLNRPEALASNLTVILRAFRNGVELTQSPQRPINPAITARPEPDRGNIQHSLNFIFPDNWTTAGSIELRTELRIPTGVVESPTDNNNLTRTVQFLAPTVAEPRISWVPVCVDGRCYNGSPAHQPLIERFLPVSESSLRYEDVPVPPIAWNRPLSELPAHLRKWKLFLDDSMLRPDVLIGWLSRAVPTTERGGAANGVAWIQDQLDDLSNQTQLAQFAARSLGMPASFGCDAAAGDPGFDPITALLIPASRQSFLAICDNTPRVTWISPADARQLTAAFKASAAGEPADYLIVSGTAASLDSAYRVTSRFSGDTAVAGSDTCLRITASDGDSDFCFTLDETSTFAVKVPVRGVISRVALRRAGSETAALIANALPSVVFDNAATGESWSGAQTLRWSAADPADRPLTFTILYSNDEGANWIPLAVDLKDTRYAIDTGALLGPSVQFRILATAGLDQVVANSGLVELVQTPALDLTSSTLDFGNATSGQFRERNLTIRNKGTGALTVNTFDGVTDPFRVAAPLPFRVRAGSQRPFPMRYRPRIPGTDSSEVLLNSNDPAAPATTVSLRAAAFDTAQPTGILSPSSLDFGAVPVGQTREATVVVRNDGAAPLNVTSLSTQNARFSVVSPLTAFTLASGEERAILCRFAPLADGLQTGFLNLSTNDPTRPSLRAEVRGTGQIFTAPRIEISNPTLDFGSVGIGQTSTLSLTARNTGAGPLTLTNITSSSNVFTIVSPATPATVAIGGEQVITLRFTPLATGPAASTITIESSDPDRPRLTVALTGTGLTGGPSLVPRISTLIPGSLTMATPRFNLTVNGVNFTATSAVQFNGSSRPTTFLSATQVRAAISPADVASAQTAQILVVNSPPGGGTSNALPLPINPPGPSGQITNVETAGCPVIQAPITVRDRIGGPITSIGGGNVACTEDGVSVPCGANLALPAGNGLSVVMVIHSSASVLDPQKQYTDILAMRASAYAYVTAANVADRVAITQMDNGVRLLTDFKDAINREALQDAIDATRSPLGVGTSLYDAIDDGLQRLATQRGRRKAMIVFTANENSYDTNGQRRDPVTLDGLYSRIQTSGVALYFFPIGDGFQNQNLLTLLNQFALDSAGQLFGDQAALQTSVITQLGETLSNQQLVTYTTPNRDGQPHLLRVNFSIPGATFIGARGYTGCR